jgi:hypothetical protein
MLQLEQGSGDQTGQSLVNQKMDGQQEKWINS